jgi:hypothetical protein
MLRFYMTLVEGVVPPEALAETAPPGKKAERFIKHRKDDFKDRYGDAWEEVLYATAWKLFGKKRKKIKEGMNFDDFWAEGMPKETVNRSKPLYLRIGTWNPNDPKSRNHAMGGREKGLSVYELDSDGNPVVPEDGEWAEEDLRDRLRSTEHPFFLVQGERLPDPGHDGEPLLENPVVVGEWEPPEGSPWAVYFRAG